MEKGKYKNLLNEAEYICSTFQGFGLLEAIMWIARHEEEYPSEIRRELRSFRYEGSEMFREVA